MNRIFSGLYCIVLTPFKENGAPDYDALERYLQKTVNTDSVDGIVLCGSTAEFTRLSFEENIQIMKVAKDVNAGKKQFICGATAGNSYTANEYADQIAMLGADGILLAPPYYFKLSDAEIYEYYRIVLNHVGRSVPVLGYNIPQCTNPVSVPVFEKLLEFENFKGYKNSWNDMQEITTEIALRDKKRPDVAMFTGLDACLYGTLALGGDGIFSAITYLMPDIINIIYSEFGKSKKSFECQCDLTELINVVNRFTFPYGYRVLSEALGQGLGTGREAIPREIKNAAYEAKKDMLKIYDKLCLKYLNRF